MVPAAHRGSHRCAQGNRERLPKSSRSGGMPAWVGTPSAGKTGHTGDPGLWGKTGHSDPRLLCAFFAKTGRSECPLPSITKYLRSVSRADRTGPRSWAQWQSHLARPGVGARLRGRLSSGEALCAQASRTATSGSRRHHPHRTRRRSTSRLRQWSDGARSEGRQVSPDTVVRSDPRLQPEICAPIVVAIQ